MSARPGSSEGCRGDSCVPSFWTLALCGAVSFQLACCSHCLLLYSVLPMRRILSLQPKFPVHCFFFVLIVIQCAYHEIFCFSLLKCTCCGDKHIHMVATAIPRQPFPFLKLKFCTHFLTNKCFLLFPHSPSFTPRKPHCCFPLGGFDLITLGVS